MHLDVVRMVSAASYRSSDYRVVRKYLASGRPFGPGLSGLDGPNAF